MKIQVAFQFYVICAVTFCCQTCNSPWRGTECCAGVWKKEWVHSSWWNGLFIAVVCLRDSVCPPETLLWQNLWQYLDLTVLANTNMKVHWSGFIPPWLKSESSCLFFLFHGYWQEVWLEVCLLIKYLDPGRGYFVFGVLRWSTEENMFHLDQRSERSDILCFFKEMTGCLAQEVTTLGCLV